MTKKRKLNGTIVICEVCGKKSYKMKAQIIRAKHHFCSKQCYNKYQHDKIVIVVCPNCNKAFIVPVTAFNFSSPRHIDFLKCWALDNLQLLPAKENISKSNKLAQAFQPSLQLEIR